MIERERTHRWLLAVLDACIVAVGAFLIGAQESERPAQALTHANVVGDATCLSCHVDKSAFPATAHHLTSRWPSRQNLLGDFSPPGNVLRTANPYLHFRMDSTANGFFQTALTSAPNAPAAAESARVDIVTGSGRRGQSYLYWKGDRLFQLPVSYWQLLGWANSPAYPDGRANFDRAIPPRCLECHAAGVESITDPFAVNRYRHDRVMLGIMCETCHGSGAQHVRNEQSPLRAFLPHGIVNPARLTRDRKMDGCALCHGGVAPLVSRPFAYVPGQRLEHTFSLRIAADTGSADVHGNQVGLLERSRCFRSSDMTCATCHDVHQPQHDLAAMSNNCLKCHQVQSCGLFPTHGNQLKGKCVDCHMPSLPSSTVIANYEGKQVRQYVRSHWIKVYGDR